MEEYQSKYKKHLLIGCFFVACIIMIVCFIITYKNTEAKKEKEWKTEVKTKQKKNNEEKPTTNELTIDIKGAVNVPGTYQLNKDNRVQNAIEKAGGVLETADTSVINLSKKLKDEMVIIVYTKQEVKDMLNELYKEKECICPVLENDACIRKDEPKTTEQKDKTSDPNQKVSINNASLEELQTISGIGETKANNIIKYREKNGGFKSIEEIKNVSGIGESTFEKIKDRLTID